MRRACDALVDRFVLRRARRRSCARCCGSARTSSTFAGVAAARGGRRDRRAGAASAARGFVNASCARSPRTPMIWPDEATALSYPDWIVERLRRRARATTPLPAMRADERAAAGDRCATTATSQDRGVAVGGRCGAGAQPGERVLDVCAAPGGKATAMAAPRRATSSPPTSRRPRARLVARQRRADSPPTPRSSSPTAPAPPFADGSVRPRAARRAVLGARRAAPASRRPLADRRRDDVDELAALQRRLLDGGGAARAPGRHAGLQRVHADRRRVDRPSRCPTGSTSIADAAGGRVAAVRARAGGCCRTTPTPTAWC